MVREADSRQVQLLGRNQAVFSSLSQDEGAGFYENYNFAPVILASFVSGDDAPMRELAGRLSRSAGVSAVSEKDDDARKFLSACYDFFNTNNVRCQTSASAKIDTHAAQSLKYGRDVILNKSGSALDLAIRFASVCENVGLKPELFLTAGNCLPAVRLPGGQSVTVDMSAPATQSYAKAVEAGEKQVQEARDKGEILEIDLAKTLPSPPVTSHPSSTSPPAVISHPASTSPPAATATKTPASTVRPAATSAALAMSKPVSPPTSVASHPAAAPPPAVAPFPKPQAKRHQKAWADYLAVPVEQANSIGMKLVLIPPGEFSMGTAADAARKSNAQAGESPSHRVKITRPFLLGAYEVSQAEYQRLMQKNPSHFAPRTVGRESFSGQAVVAIPVESVSWTMAREFCHRLSGLAAEQSAGRVYRLPTEAEWEYACRAGSTTRWYFDGADKTADGASAAASEKLTDGLTK